MRSPWGMTIRSCRFEGPATPLVQGGARTEIIRDDARVEGMPYAVVRNDFGIDLSLLSFEDCDFRVSGYFENWRSVGVDMRANQSLPTRFRRCDFSGSASAMLSLWGGTFYLEGCRFENARVPSAELPPESTSQPRGLETPDGSDIFLHAEYPMLVSLRDAVEFFGSFPRIQVSGLTDPVVVYTNQDYLPGLLALGCVSKSAQVLSTVAPGQSVREQAADWPVTFVGTRHRAPVGSTLPSMRWGLQNTFSAASRGEPSTRDMNRGGPLAVIGGVLSGDILFLLGACQGAVVGVRTGRLPGVRMEGMNYPATPWPPTTVFGLPADQR